MHYIIFEIWAVVSFKFKNRQKAGQWWPHHYSQHSGGWGRQISVSLRPAWSTEGVSGQSGLAKKPCLKQTNKKTNKHHPTSTDTKASNLYHEDRHHNHCGHAVHLLQLSFFGHLPRISSSPWGPPHGIRVWLCGIPEAFQPWLRPAKCGHPAEETGGYPPTRDQDKHHEAHGENPNKSSV